MIARTTSGLVTPRWWIAALAAVAHGCGSSGGGGSPVAASPSPVSDPDPVYEIALVADDATAPDACMAPLFAPGDLSQPILATTADIDAHRNATGFLEDAAPIATFPRHLTDGGPTMTLDTGVELTDDLRILIGTNGSGQFVSLQIRGQPLIGAESLDHESEIIQLAQSVDPLNTQAFVVHVDTLQPVPVWQLTGHLGGERAQIVGHFCLGDLVFTPIVPGPNHD